MKAPIKHIFVLSLLSLSIVGATALADTREFCAGFERGYITGYKRASERSIDPLTPLCPLQPLKGFGDPESDYEHGYAIGYDKGMDEGSR